MEIRVPDMQPVRFYKPGNTPDYSSYFPNLDNITPRVKYVDGVYPTKHYTDWLINKEMFLQFRVSVTTSSDWSIYKLNESTGIYAIYDTISAVDITPDSWVSNDVYRYSYTFTEAGVYYLDSSSAGYRSDKFVVHSDEKFRRRLTEIVYYNDRNDYGMVFWDGTTQRFTGRAYFTGALMPDTPGGEVSAQITDRGEISKRVVTPTRTAVLKLNDIHYADINRANLILSCNNLTINGIMYSNDKQPEIKQITKTDLVNITLPLTQNDYEYFIQ